MIKENFDPKRPFRTRDGLEARVRRLCGEVCFDGQWVQIDYNPDGTHMWGKRDIDLVNLPEAPSAEVEDKGETDAARLQRLMAERTDTFSPVHLKNEDAGWLFSLARRAALVPDAEAAEWQWRTLHLERPGPWQNAFSEQDARQRAYDIDKQAEREFAMADIGAPGEPHPVRAADAEPVVSEAEVDAAWRYVLLIAELSRNDLRVALEAAARVRPATTGEGWRPQYTTEAGEAAQQYVRECNGYGDACLSALFRWEECFNLMLAAAQPDLTPVPSTDATGGTAVDAMGAVIEYRDLIRRRQP